MYVKLLNTLATMLLLNLPTNAGGTYFKVDYDGSKTAGELVYGVTYTLWVPNDTPTLRGVIVHQHGCGAGACKGGETAAYDLHWQALATKWNCALLGPSYHQKDGENCQLWCDPRNGSRKTFLKSLEDLATKSKHAELAKVPWCLWGHSGGGMWASLMMASDPERIVAVWLRSGTAFDRKDKDFKAFVYPEAAYRIPVMANPGFHEESDKRFHVLYDACWAMYKSFREKDAPFAVAVDPKSNHDCGESRYLAIPWFDACLKLQLPDKTGEPLKTKIGSAYYEILNGKLIETPARERPWATHWMPAKEVAKSWYDYSTEGVVPDTTAPPPPHKAIIKDGKLTWDCVADFESGLSGFVILKDGVEVAKLMGKGNAKQGRPLFQGKSYHDTPEPNLPKMELAVDAAGEYTIIAVNGAGLKSTAVAAKR